MRDEDRTNVYDFINEYTYLMKICFHKFDKYICEIYENIKILMNFDIPDIRRIKITLKKVNRKLGYNSLTSKFFL